VLQLGSGATVVRAEPFVALTDNHSEMAAEIAQEGHAPAARTMRMQVYLAPRNERELDRLVADQQNPASPRYHRWLGADEYERRFGPTQADVDEVSRWLGGNGFRVTYASAAEGRIAFEGDVGTTERSFQTRIAASLDGKYFANATDPMVPAWLAPKIGYVAGLHNLSASTMNSIIADPKNNNGITNAHFGPPDVWTYYNEHGLLAASMDGTGQCISALEGSDVDQASLTDFDTVFGLPAFVQGQNYDTVYPDGPTGIEPPVDNRSAQAYAEALVDIEWAHGVAPGAEIVLYAGNHGGLGTQGLVDTLKAATSDNRCAVLTISWAQCGEPKSFFRMLDQSYKRGVAQGQSIFVATGDVGVAAPTLFDRRTGGCRIPTRPEIEENAGSPNVTAIGATQVQNAQYDGSGIDSGVGMPAEAVWDFNIGTFIQGATTGGVSAVFKKPKFQKGIKSAKFKKRGVPDICLGAGIPARPGYWECLDFGLAHNGVSVGPSCTSGGGTSVAAPQWAAVVAIIAQKKNARVGNIDPQLYAMAKANLSNLAAVGIRDVTDGNNTYLPLTGYNAGPGYDLASGWGSIDIGNFVTAFTGFTPPGRH
jgi:kumamolisin